MLLKSISQSVEVFWDKILHHVKDSLVLMDDSTAECLHWCGSLQRLLNNGVYSTENFSPFVKADPKVTKAVFILMSPFTEETLRTLMIVIRSNAFKTCIVITSFSAKYHSEVSNIADPFGNLENHLLNWMGNMNYTASVYHLPTFFAQISPCFWIMPSLFKPLSTFNCGMVEMNTRRNEALTFKSLPPEMLPAFKQLVHSLHFCLDSNNVRGDFFSLGSLSNLLCSELESFSHSLKKTYPNKASVVVVDRILDLAGPLSQSYDTMLDKIQCALPPLNGQVFDVAVSMTDLASCKEDIVFDRPLLAPGCIAHKNNSYEEAALKALLCKKSREVLIEINRLVVDLASKEKINLDFNSRLTPEVLKSRVLSFKQKFESLLKFNGLIQQSLAVTQALEYSLANNIENLSAMEKALMEYLAISSAEVLNYIMQMIAEKDEMNYKMDELLIFIAFVYMLCDDEEIANESSLQVTLMEIFFHENMDTLRSLFVNLEEKNNDEHILEAVRTYFIVLKRLSTVRKGFKKYLTLFKSKNPAFPVAYDSLIKQLMDDLFNTTAGDASDLEYHSLGLKDYIKTGFSLFMNVAKPKPQDNPVIFLVVLGSVTPSEIKLIYEVAAQNKETEIILLSAGVSKPMDVLKDIGLIVKELLSPTEDNDV